ncbi:hypothetical protein QTH91_05915 [Variovorax dokdonensis]|uniref:Uncharacterized protein n=1 Tax=Variovorax dokdonensis TaxID=344883 RepID=A0ABT7N7V3_9BURK|nr:hypothetical protein [Variovorax dokdonensis]MDM0044010.1 hypothetical protein [Variovorax dokdonensis]
MKILIQDGKAWVNDVEAEPLFPAGVWRAGSAVVTVQVTTSRRWVKAILAQQFRRNTGGRPPSQSAADLAKRVNEAMARGLQHMDAIRQVASNSGLTPTAVRLKVRRYNSRS